MPDDPTSKSIRNDGQAEPPPTPAVEQQPRTGDAAQIGEGDMSTEIKSLEDRVKKGELWMIGLTGAITLFALCSVIVGILQWSAMKAQLAEMQSGGRDTHTLAETAVASNRPWIGIDRIPTVRQESERWYIDFSIKNFGPSPALHAVVSSGVENVTTPEEVNKAVERYCTVGEQLTISGDSGTGTGEHGYALFPGKIAQLQTIAVPNRQNIVYLIGCATYFDQFGKRPVHHTGFCYYKKTPLGANKTMFACFEGWNAD